MLLEKYPAVTSEARPAESETLISRLIDRPIRPIVPIKFYE